MMVKKIEEMSYDPELIGLYDKEKMDNFVNGINLADAEKKGLEQGFEQGSKNEKLEIAKNMLNKKMDM